MNTWADARRGTDSTSKARATTVQRFDRFIMTSPRNRAWRHRRTTTAVLASSGHRDASSVFSIPSSMIRRSRPAVSHLVIASF